MNAYTKKTLTSNRLGTKAWLLSFLLSFIYTGAWAETKAYLNQEIYYEGDPVTLTIETNTSANVNPNLSPLKKDFQIMGSSSSTQINILNGNKRTKKTWSVDLQPQRKGKIEIPAIQVGQEVTKPVNLVIADIPAAMQKETSKHIFIESSVDLEDNQTYVQQQIPYTVRLYYDASMKSGQIYSPSVENAVVEQLGQDRRYRTVRMGKKYSVIEKHFVISPEKSGKLLIPPSSVKGQIAVDTPTTQNNKRSQDETDFMNRFFNNSPFANDPFFNDFGSSFFSGRSRTPSKPFLATTEAIEVEVKAIPSEFTGNIWLPAEDVNIQDSWTTQPPDLRVGEPVTRTITIQAKGLAGSQIPEIKISKPDNIRIYPEQAKTNTRTDGKTVYGIAEMNISYIPDSSGKIRIPGIKLDWWDIRNKTQKTSTLPNWDLTVAPGVGGTKSNFNQPSVNSQASNESPLTDTKNPPDTHPPLSEQQAQSHQKWLVWLSLLSLIAILVLIYLKRPISNVLRTRLQPSRGSARTHQKSIIRLEEKLKQACQTNNPESAEKNLLALIKASWKTENPPRNLKALSEQVSQGKQAILELESVLYASDSATWEGDKLLNAIQQEIKPKDLPANSHQPILKPLYPAS